MEGRASTIIPNMTPCLQCIFPEAPPAGKFPVIGVSPGLIALIEATETVKYLTGIGRLLENRLLIYDEKQMEFSEIGISKKPDCPVFGGKKLMRILESQGDRSTSGSDQTRMRKTR